MVCEMRRLLILIWFIPALCWGQIEKNKVIGVGDFGIWKNCSTPEAEAGTDVEMYTGTAAIAMTGATAEGDYETVAWSGGTGKGTWTQNDDPALAVFTPSINTGTFTATLTLTGCGQTITDTRTVAWYNPYLATLMARMSVPISTTTDKYVNSIVIDTLQYYHIACNTNSATDTLDFYYDFVMPNSQAATLDWIRQAITATLVNSPTHTAYQGYTTDGASSYIKANYNPGTDSVHWAVNSASTGVYIRTNDMTNGNYLYGIDDGTNSVFSITKITYLRNRINSGNNFDVAIDNQGFTILTRQNSSTIVYADNGNSYSTASNTVGASPNQASGIYIGANNSSGSAGSYTANQFSFAFGGGQLTETQKTKLYLIQEWKLDQYGFGVNP